MILALEFLELQQGYCGGANGPTEIVDFADVGFGDVEFAFDVEFQDAAKRGDLVAHVGGFFEHGLKLPPPLSAIAGVALLELCGEERMAVLVDAFGEPVAVELSGNAEFGLWNGDEHEHEGRLFSPATATVLDGAVVGAALGEDANGARSAGVVGEHFEIGENAGIDFQGHAATGVGIGAELQAADVFDGAESLPEIGMVEIDGSGAQFWRSRRFWAD